LPPATVEKKQKHILSGTSATETPFVTLVALQSRLIGKKVETASALVVYSAISLIVLAMVIMEPLVPRLIGGEADPLVLM
jgi:hypothetical protein